VNCTHPTPSVLARAVAVFVVFAALSACSSSAHNEASGPLKVLPPNELDGLLLSADDINSVMGTSAMAPGQVASELPDNHSLMANVNCLGIWQVGEKALYGDSGLTGVRVQTLRQPDNDTWEYRVAQAAAAYPTPEVAKTFLDQSADHWSKCTNHRVNITLNDQPTRTWWFADLTESANQLSMTVTRGENEKSCQRVLSLASNVIVDVQACGPTSADQAATIAHKMTDHIGH
jgi:hypothetical protein